MLTTSTSNSQLSFTPTLRSSISPAPDAADTPSFRSPEIDAFKEKQRDNENNKEITQSMEEEESQTYGKSTINATTPISFAFNASREVSDFQQSQVQQPLQFQQQDTYSARQNDIQSSQVGAIRREQLLASLLSLEMKIQWMNDIKNKQEGEGCSGRRDSNNLQEIQVADLQQKQQELANNTNTSPFKHKAHQEESLQQKQSNNNSNTLDRQNQQLRASELRHSLVEYQKKEQSSNEESDSFLESIIKEEYIPKEQELERRTQETKQSRHAYNEPLNSRHIQYLQQQQQQQQLQLKQQQQQQHGCSPLLLLSPRKIFQQQTQQQSSPQKQILPGLKIEADSSCKLFNSDKLHEFTSRCGGGLLSDYPNNNNKSGFVQTHRQTLQQQSCTNDIAGGTYSSSSSFSALKLKNKRFSQEQSQQMYCQNIMSSGSKSSAREESCISEEEDEDGMMAMRNEYSTMSESKAKEFGFIKELINRIVNTLDREEAVNTEQTPKQFITENEQLTEKQKEEYLLICSSLIRKFRQLKKTKEEKTKFIMRKAFRYLFSQLKTCCPAKMNLKEANEICMKHYFSQHVHDSQLVLPFRRNSSIKTMNAAFLKKVFASSTFARDYRNFLKYFDALAMQDNQKKVEQLSYYILPMIEESKFDKIESLRRLPWTMHLLNSTKSLAHSLLEFEDSQHSAMLHYSIPQFTQSPGVLQQQHCSQTTQRIQQQKGSPSMPQHFQYLDSLSLHTPTVKIQQLSSSEKTISIDGCPRKRSLSDSQQSFQFNNSNFLLPSTSTSSSSASSSETDSKVSNEEISSYLDQINGVLANMADVQQNNGVVSSSWQTCSTAMRSLKRKIIIITPPPPPQGFFENSMKKNCCEMSNNNNNNNQGNRNINNMPNASK